MAKRSCADCGADISGLNVAVKRCPECCAGTMRAAGLDPLEPYPGSQKRWHCRCMKCGTEVTPMYCNIRNGWGGCRDCSYKARGQASRIPELEAAATLRAAGLEPLEPYPGRHKAWHSRCIACGEETSPELGNIKLGKGGCKHCAQRATIPHKARAIMLAAGLEPIGPFPGADKPWASQCLRCKRSVDPTFGAIQAGGGCRYCNNGVPLAEDAIKLMRAHGLEPLEDFPGASKRWRSRCIKCRRVVYPSLDHVRRSPGGCRWCRARGFKAHKKAIVYLITHDGYGAAKIGITDAKGGRLTLHRRRGWQVAATIGVPGETAMVIEVAILDWWRRELRLPVHLGRPEMPQGGWTETAALCEVDLAATVRRMWRLATQP